MHKKREDGGKNGVDAPLDGPLNGYAFNAATKRENKNPQKKVYHTWDEPPHTAGECKRCGGPIGANYWKLREGREGWELEAGCEFFFRRRKVTLRESQGAQLFSTCSPSLPVPLLSFSLSPLSSLFSDKLYTYHTSKSSEEEGKNAQQPRSSRGTRKKGKERKDLALSLSLSLSFSLFLFLSLSLFLSISLSPSLSLPPPLPFLSFLLDPRPHHTFST